MLSSAVLLCSAAASGQGRAPDAPEFRFDSLFVEQSTLGSRRVGLLCLPWGSLMWRDAAAPDKLLTSGMVAQIVAEGVGAGASASLGAQVVRLKVKSCAKHYGLGDAGALSGSGTITVRWSGLGDGGQSVTTVSPFKFEGAQAGSGAILAAAMRAATASLAPHLAKGSSGRR